MSLPYIELELDREGCLRWVWQRCGKMGVAYLKGTLEHVDEEFVGNDIQFLLILSLNVSLAYSLSSVKSRQRQKNPQLPKMILMNHPLPLVAKS